MKIIDKVADAVYPELYPPYRAMNALTQKIEDRLKEVDLTHEGTDFNNSRFDLASALFQRVANNGNPVEYLTCADGDGSVAPYNALPLAIQYTRFDFGRSSDGLYHLIKEELTRAKAQGVDRDSLFQINPRLKAYYPRSRRAEPADTLLSLKPGFPEGTDAEHAKSELEKVGKAALEEGDGLKLAVVLNGMLHEYLTGPIMQGYPDDCKVAERFVAERKAAQAAQKELQELYRELEPGKGLDSKEFGTHGRGA